MPDKTNSYRTKDLYSAVVLRTIGYPLMTLEKSDRNHTFFVFDDGDSSAQDTLQRHWNGELEVNSRSFVESVRELKTRLHGQSNFPG